MFPPDPKVLLTHTKKDPTQQFVNDHSTMHKPRISTHKKDPTRKSGNDSTTKPRISKAFFGRGIINNPLRWHKYQNYAQVHSMKMGTTKAQRQSANNLSAYTKATKI